MTLNTTGRRDARPLDIFKTIVAVILAIIAIILLLQGAANIGRLDDEHGHRRRPAAGC